MWQIRKPRASSMALQARLTALVLSAALFFTAHQPTHAQEGKAVHESPYYIPGLSSIPFNFSGSAEGSGAFRVLGATTDGLSLSFTHAEASCLALEGGKGLAVVNSAQRRAALNSAIIESMGSQDDTGKNEMAVRAPADLHWVGGWRTSLSDENCTTSAKASWPYFTVDAASGQATDYGGCGTDPVHDWVWRSLHHSGKMVEEPFTSNLGVEQWWEDSSVTGVGNEHEPSGWDGAVFTLANGDRYQNCTAARVYSRTDNKDVQPAAAGKAWLNDEICTDTLQRWVCEMESASAASDGLAASSAAESGKVAQSPFYISNISDTAHPAHDDTSTALGSSVYRVLGIPPAADADFAFESSSHVLTWEGAQKACLDMGGLALAAPEEPAVDRPAFSFLKEVSEALVSAESAAATEDTVDMIAEGPVQTLPAFWMSAVYLSPPAAASGEETASKAGWTWFPTVARGDTGNLLLSNASAEWPMAGNETRWDIGYPNKELFETTQELPIQSCVAAVWPEGGTGEMWRNHACSTHDVRYFICRFPDSSAGMPPSAAAGEEATRGGLLQNLPFDREILLIICISSLCLLAALLCCASCMGSRSKDENIIAASSVKNILRKENSKAGVLFATTKSLDPLRKSGGYVLGGKDSLATGKWGDLPEIAENEAMGEEGHGPIRATGSTHHRPQVLREHAVPMTCDSIDTATRCMKASSYWSIGDTMETEAALGNSMHETVVDVGSGGKGTKAMHAQCEPRQIQITDPTSEPSQGALQCEPTVLAVPRSPAAASPGALSSPESIGMRIPAALRWSQSPRSDERASSPSRPSEDGQSKQQGAGGKLLQRLRSVAHRAGRATDIVGQRGLQHPQHNHHHMQTSRSPRRSPSPQTTETGTDPHVPLPNPAEHTPEAVAPARGYSGTPSQMSLPSSQREFVSEEKCRTADGNVVTTHVFRRPSPQISPESSFAEDQPRTASFHSCAPPQLSIPSDSTKPSPSFDPAADEPLSARAHMHSDREPSPRPGRRRSLSPNNGAVYACQQYPPSPQTNNDLEPGPREDSGGLIDMLRGAYPPPPNFTTVVPSPTSSMPRHSSVQTNGSNQTMGSISVFAAEPSQASLSLEGPRHRMAPALTRYNSKAVTSKKFFSGQAMGSNGAAQSSVEFPRGDSASTMTVSTPWRNNPVLSGATVNTSSDLVPLSDSGRSPYHQQHTDSPRAPSPEHSRGDVEVPTSAASRYAPQFQSVTESKPPAKPPLSYLATADALRSSVAHSRSTSVPKSPTSPAPRPGRPHTLDASIDYKPQSIWSQVTPQDVSEGLDDAGTFSPFTQTTALQHFSGTTATSTNAPSTPRHADNTRSTTPLTSPEITTFLASSSHGGNNSSEGTVVVNVANLPSPQQGLASCGTVSNACSSPSQWTLESSEFGWQGNRGVPTPTGSNQTDSLAAAVAARTCPSPQACRSPGAGPMPVSNTAAPQPVQLASAKQPSAHRSSVTSLESTAGMRGRLPTLPESMDEQGSAALVDAWLTSLKVDEGAKEAVERLTTALDALSVDPANGKFGTVFGQFKLHGPMERIVGGQGVVAFATEVKQDAAAPSAPEPQVALKFYVQPDLIQMETAVYGNPTLASFGALPRSAQLHLNTRNAHHTAPGAILPPCLAMERGMSLKEWMAHSRINSTNLANDCKTAIKALLHLSQCLVALHSSGFVHRDVKPGAVLWLPSEHRWVLVNFCRAARIGASTPAPCSLSYAAPEVAANASCAADGGVHAGATPMPASTAADMWSLGVVALELFSRARALDVHGNGVEMVLSQLQGRTLLPWEREPWEKQDGLRCLGPLAACVGRLLSRDPSKRPCAADFVRDATAALESVAS